MVAGNLIGFAPGSIAAIGNRFDGVQIDFGPSANTIGGSAAVERNVISSNSGDGVEISDGGTAGNVIAGNYIGTDSGGSQAEPNYAGVEIDGGASGNTVGTDGNGVNDVSERNIISGNLLAGVLITDSGTENNVVAGNYIGTAVDGMGVLGNGSANYHNPR